MISRCAYLYTLGRHVPIRNEGTGWTKETFGVLSVYIYNVCGHVLGARVTRGTVGARGTFVAICLCILWVGMLPLGTRGTRGGIFVTFVVICVCMFFFFF